MRRGSSLKSSAWQPEGGGMGVGKSKGGVIGSLMKGGAWERVCMCVYVW